MWGTYVAVGLGSVLVLYLLLRHEVPTPGTSVHWQGAKAEALILRLANWYIFGAAFTQGTVPLTLLYWCDFKRGTGTVIYR